jgi:crotonyl-CoA reductase
VRGDRRSATGEDVHYGKVGILALVPHERPGVCDQEFRARHLGDINRVRTSEETR